MRNHIARRPTCFKGIHPEYREANREKINAKAREYNKTNRERRAEYERANRAKRTARHREKKYGITQNALNALIDAQGGACAICELPLAALAQRDINVDHCHSTGTIRGVLCRHCNHGLGHFRDSPAALRRAADYLERGSAQMKIALDYDATHTADNKFWNMFLSLALMHGHEVNKVSAE